MSGLGDDTIVLEDLFGPIPTAEDFDHRPPCETFDEMDFGDGEGEGGACLPPWDLEPEQRTTAPFAPGLQAPLWPVGEREPVVAYRDVRGKWHGQWGHHLGTTRLGDDGTKRHHAGVDLPGEEGDRVVAMEGGEIIATLPFHHGTWAVYVRHDSGPIVNYGEVAKHSWQRFGVPMRVVEGETPTLRVEAGEPIAVVGRMSGGSAMLHLEIYAPEVTVDEIREGSMQWRFGESAPPGLLDPTNVLVTAQRQWYLPKTT